MTACAHLLILGVTIALAGVAKSAEQLPWKRSAWFDESSFTETNDLKVRYHVNAPLDRAGKSCRATRLILYALPNGNTIEQTLGCKMAEGLDWHYDIHCARMRRGARPIVAGVSQIGAGR
jgi:hypothetical protein